ncbi:hypothetical protein Lal_00006856 [Lupinus albus]|uniref:Putative Rab-GTPase-TBC domain-containing protein n=1 Tax=Lupinus albus TaxID=3870 RepID=A0A6A4Q7Y8_LUPAL|nr:putative Rab-GTPase-TBC domain-containing protein [Lupinus albus]KAF1876225.1 hypothetical protein Lal_00006856 [Lupinus albus]
MSPTVMGPPLPKSSSVSLVSSDNVSDRLSDQFEDLRSLQWRINLGVLPSSPSTSIDDLRRTTADSRRRYASLRGHLLVDPHISKDGSRSPSPNLIIDNPLSQNPDSTWGRYFRNAELERMVDQDLSRLYPEHGSYFQTPGCQGTLRRILLLWCLRHPECGYRQGMHELLAPLLYVLQVDVESHSDVRKVYEDHFTDRFDGLFCQENDLSYNFDFRKSPDLMDDEIGSHGNAMKIKTLDELDPKIRTIVLLSDAYGAEGELGIVLSEKFMEHDAYCMFDALMNGSRGSVAMVDFFSYSPLAGSHSGLPPVIEASTALYYLLSCVDSSLHSHLVDLGVEPQYFALRWLRVLFGREFSLANLLIIWDEIFLSDNDKVVKCAEDNTDSGFNIFHSSRGAFISAMAVAMLLHLRTSLLATENPTTCLQRLLSFPEKTNIKKLLEKAKSLQALALSSDISSSTPSFVGGHNQGKSIITRSRTLPSESDSPKTPLNLFPDSYWEEQWRVVHKAEEHKKDELQKQVPTRKKGWTEKVKLSLKRAESHPFSSTIKTGKKESEVNVRHNLLEDLSKELGFEEDTEKLHCHEFVCQQDNLSVAGEVEQESDGSEGCNSYSADDRCLSGNIGSEENLSITSGLASPPNEANDHENYLGKSSVGSNLFLDEINEITNISPVDSPLPISDPPECISQTSGCKNDSMGNLATNAKERKVNKFQWLWKFGRNNGQVISEKGEGVSEAVKPTNKKYNDRSTTSSSTADANCSSVSCNGDSVDQNEMRTLRNIGQSMLEHIQVIESSIQLEPGDNLSKYVLVTTGQVTAMTALKELRKISDLLSEM